MEGAYVGHDGLRRFVADNDASFELFAIRIDELHETGDQVVAVGTVRVRGCGVGTETEVAVAGIFEFRGEKISRWEDLRERGTALAAAGLSA
jgi:ketosteroid isomerase-like protein